MHGTGSGEIEVTHGRLSHMLNHKQCRDAYSNSHRPSRHTWHQALPDISWHPHVHSKQRSEKECCHPENKCTEQEVVKLKSNTDASLATHIVLLVILGTKLHQIFHDIHMSLLRSVVKKSPVILKTNTRNRKW
jgi:hypothetical protein